MGDNYEAINDIDKCVSFDSQGFSFEFLKKYSQAIENRADKITSYCPTEATVGGCMSSIPGIEEKFIDIGFPNAFPIGYHMPAEMLNEKGEFKQEGEPSLKYTLLKKATTCTLAITEKLPGIDVEKTLVEVGEFIDAVVNKGDVLGEGKDLIFSKDSIIVLGILLKELEPLVDLNKATLGITVAGATINEIDNCIEEIAELVESGDIIQAIDKADETFHKVRLGLLLYQGGMLTGNQVVGAVNFIIGWNAGKLENKIRTTIRDKVCEATVYVCKEIYEAGVGAYEAGKKAGKYVKKNNIFIKSLLRYKLIMV